MSSKLAIEGILPIKQLFVVAARVEDPNLVDQWFPTIYNNMVVIICNCFDYTHNSMIFFW